MKYLKGLCPYCKRVDYLSALARDNITEICSICATREALDEYFN